MVAVSTASGFLCSGLCTESHTVMKCKYAGFADLAWGKDRACAISPTAMYVLANRSTVHGGNSRKRVASTGWFRLCAADAVGTR